MALTALPILLYEIQLERALKRRRTDKNAKFKKTVTKLTQNLSEFVTPSHRGEVW